MATDTAAPAEPSYVQPTIDVPALTELLDGRYREVRDLVRTNLADYAFPSAAELPSFDLVPLETPTPVNPLGAKGIGESGAIGATPAVQSAVLDALSPFGVDHLDMPLTAEKVWRAVTAGPG